MTKDSVIVGNIRIPLYSVNTLIIGSGAAALAAAVYLHDYGQKDVLIVTDNWGGGTSNNAGSDKQTYYKLSLAGDKSDSPFDMAYDLFSGGCMHGDIALVEAQHSAQCFYRLVQSGVPFPHDRYGGYTGYRTDHDPRGRATSAGPLTSHLMFEALAEKVEQKSINKLDKHEVICLLKEKNKGEKRVIGAVALDQGGLHNENLGFVAFNAVNVILATGGPAGMFKTAVYPESQTGSSGLALRIGARGQNLTESQFGLASTEFRWNLSGSYQQVIPRYFSTDEGGKDEREFLNDYFLESEVLSRAIFLKGYQWPFDPRKIRNFGSSLIDLLVYQETVQKQRRVFLDYTRNYAGFSLESMDRGAYAYLKKSSALQSTPIERLRSLNQPAIDLYKNNSIDLTKEPLEIAVCAQHNNGGLSGNIWWESNIRHLFPIGEVNGSHGVYRPGGAALNAGQVGGLRAALYIAKRYHQAPPPADYFQTTALTQVQQVFDQARNAIRPDTDGKIIHSALEELQERMSEQGAHIRNPAKIGIAVEESWTLYGKLRKEGYVDNPGKLPQLFKVLDLCLTHAVYLGAIQEYIVKGGQSRGSYLILDPEGEKACELLDDDWRFKLAEKDDFATQRILEIWIDDQQKIRKNWVNVRPIPGEPGWFEEVWKKFREDTIIR